MKFLLTIGLFLAISFVACSSDGEEGSGFMPTDTTNVVKKTETLPVKVFKPDDTVSSSGSGDDDEDSNSKTTSEGSGASGEGELPTTLIRLSTVVATTGRPETSTKFIAQQSTSAISTVHPTEDEGSAATTKNFVDVVTTERTATEMDNNIPDEEPTDDQGNDVGGTLGSQRNDNPAAPSTKKRKRKTGLSFTLGIVIGVVIGAILAILIILFLVYRLRKKDEGSYALGDPATGYYKDDPGSPISNKEYFA